MLIKIIFTITFFMATLSASEFNPQKEFNDYCAETAKECYARLNQNVTFSKEIRTESLMWESIEIIGTGVLVKKRGIPLSSALDDLTEKESNTSFECIMARCYCFYKILEQYNLDVVIQGLENEDAGFKFPFYTFWFLVPLENISFSQGFYFRPGNCAFARSGKDELIVNMKEEWAKIEWVRSHFDRLTQKLENCIMSVPQHEKPYRTIKGGILYLPNVKWVTGVGRGENLYLIDDKIGLYYGFGPTFKDGPKVLLEIARDLEQYAKVHHPGLYESQFQEFKKSGSVVPEGEHFLQYLIIPEMGCQYYSLTKLEKLISEMQSKETLDPFVLDWLYATDIANNASTLFYVLSKVYA